VTVYQRFWQYGAVRGEYLFLHIILINGSLHSFQSPTDECS